MEKNRIYLGRSGDTWSYKKYYYEKDTNKFIEEKYHEAYLDPETILDATFEVSPQKIYAEFIEQMDSDGIKLLLQYCKDIEPVQTENESAEKEFYQKLKDVNETLRYRIRKTGDAYILHDTYNLMVAVIFKTEHFYVYVDKFRKEKGFVSLKETFDYAVNCMSCYYPVAQNNNTVSE